MSDEYDPQDEFDSAFLNELDEIEARQLSSSNTLSRLESQSFEQRQPRSRNTETISSDFDFPSFNIGSDEMERLDQFIADSHAGKARPQTSWPAEGLNRTRQTTLDGRTLPHSPRKSQPLRSSSGASTSRSQAPLFGYRPKKTKFWDHTTFSETGWMSTKGKSKASGARKGKREEDKEEEEMEFEQFPAPSTTGELPAPMKLKPDLVACRNWIFPTNREKRDYQFNIAYKCLFDNTLVALPTGLGKTFIAGVVMLNYYKWFPDGKIVFVAPTKPLVAQQIQACHDICGIPGRDAAELTGNVPKFKRISAWAEKRVLYMTPQTLRNDLSNGLADPRDIIMLVIDEAHRGTGDYAYAQVIRYMMAKNPHFRVLALTATPGNKPEAVQAIVDALHISHIEIRNEQSPDIHKYIHNKTVQIHIVKMNKQITGPRDLLAELMEPFMQKLRKAQILYTTNPLLLHSYACQAAQRDLSSKPNAKALAWAYADLKILGMLARAMGYLVENSSRMCHQVLKSIRETINTSDKPSDKRLREVLKTETYIRLQGMLEQYEITGFPPHPKMDLLLSLVLSHFTNSGVNEPSEPERVTSANGSKIMVFVQFRDCVNEIVRMFDQHQPMLRAAAFIGQGIDKQGRKGLAQTDQLGVLQRFKNGEHNILVSTSIGEEGLDIGEIDRIVCYDAQKSAVRMLQRVGRTGRKRAGYVDVLVAEEREEKNWEKSKENYSDVQYSIISGNQLEFYGDVERLLPDSVQPECLAAPMEIEQYDRNAQNDKSSPKVSKGRKRTRNNDINRNIPLGALTGFVTASELRPKARKVKTSGLLQGSDLDEDTDDAEIVAGIHGTPPKRKKSPFESRLKLAAKPKTNSKAKGKRKPLDKNMKTAFLPERLEDDKDDKDIQLGIKAFFRKSTQHGPGDASVSTNKPSRLPVDISASSPNNEDEDLATGIPSPRLVVLPTPLFDVTPDSANRKAACDWLLDVSDSSSEGDNRIPVSSPLRTVQQNWKKRSDQDHDHTRALQQQSKQDCSVTLIVSETKNENKNEESITSPLRDNTNGEHPCASPESSFRIRQPTARKRRKQQTPPSSPREEHSFAPRRITRRLCSPRLMPPPPLPAKSPVDCQQVVASQRSSCSEREGERQSQQAPQQQPSPPQFRRRKRAKLDMRSNPLLFDVEAQHSGEEVSADDGWSSCEDASESDSDRRFLEELDASQASPSYNQTAAYRLGLLTQLPDGVDGPRFARRPKRVGPFAGGRTQIPQPTDCSSSPAQTCNEPDEYEMGSFVVRDDDTFLYDESSDI